MSQPVKTEEAHLAVLDWYKEMPVSFLVSSAPRRIVDRGRTKGWRAVCIRMPPQPGVLQFSDLTGVLFSSVEGLGVEQEVNKRSLVAGFAQSRPQHQTSVPIFHHPCFLLSAFHPVPQDAQSNRKQRLLEPVLARIPTCWLGLVMLSPAIQAAHKIFWLAREA